MHDHTLKIHTVYIPMYDIAHTYIYNNEILNSLIQHPISNVSIFIFSDIISDHVSTINIFFHFIVNLLNFSIRLPLIFASRESMNICMILVIFHMAVVSNFWLVWWPFSRFSLGNLYLSCSMDCRLGYNIPSEDEHMYCNGF